MSTPRSTKSQSSEKILNTGSAERYNVEPLAIPKVEHGAVKDAAHNVNERLNGFRILHFSPAWFSITMGAGIPTTLLLELPYPELVPRLRPFAAVFLFQDIVFFLCFSTAFSIRYIRHPSIFSYTLTHPMMSAYLGTIPMTMGTLVSGITALTRSYGMSLNWVYAMSYCWWISFVLSAAVGLFVPFITFTKQKVMLETSTAVLLLPVVAAVTTAAVGGGLVGILAEDAPAYAYHVWLGSYVQLGLGLPVALGIFALYLQRLVVYHIPAKEIIVSSFLPLGPCGLGGFSLLKLDKVATVLLPELVPERSQELAALALGLYGGGCCGSLLLWALGIWFALIAVLSFLQRWKEGGLKFNIGWWGLTFPLASMTLSTLLLGKELSSTGLQVIGTGFTICVISFWAVLLPLQVKGVIQGGRHVFAAPDLHGWEEKRASAANMV